MKPHSEKEKEFNLSAKIEGQMKSIGKSLPLEDVKEFIRLLKDTPEMFMSYKKYCEWIDKLAGDKLI